MIFPKTKCVAGYHCNPSDPPEIPATPIRDNDKESPDLLKTFSINENGILFEPYI